jgi:hypothetical protein
MTLTTRRRSLDGAELATTGLAVVVSSALYLRQREPYLARGVVGDLLGFTILGAVLAVRRRRLRHEALVCLAGIGGVLSLDPTWPLRPASGFWWGTVAIGLTAYLVVRQRLLGDG